jgi:uncharacterized protein (DUF433 family)
MPARKKRTPETLRVGSTVCFRFGITDVTAQVIEDRGPLGKDGERIYRVRFDFAGADEPTETEIEASRLTVVPSAARPRRGSAEGETRNIPYPRIARSPRIRGGQPVVAGTRIPVATIVRSHQLGMDFDELLLQYPSLVAADLHAAMLYFLDHRAEIDALLREADEPPPGATIVR